MIARKLMIERNYTQHASCLIATNSADDMKYKKGLGSGLSQLSTVCLRALSDATGYHNNDKETQSCAKSPTTMPQSRL